MNPLLAPTLLLLCAPVVGSFLGVLIDRLPRGESIVLPRSACRSCGTTLSPRDLIPILSYALARGRCRYCAAPLPGWLIHSEVAATGAAVIAVIFAATPLQMLGIACVLWLLWTLAVTDLLHFRLPDPLTGALFLIAMGLSFLPGGDPAAALMGAAIGAGSFLALRLGYRALRGREGLGLGDVKLMVGLGALTGPFDLPLLVLGAALSALAAALFRGGWRADKALPFGAALAMAGAVVWLANNAPI